jgi:hypothetical protein
MLSQRLSQDSDGVEFAEDDDELVLHVPLPEGTVARSVEVTLTKAQLLRVDVKDRGTVLAGVLTGRVKDHLWTLQDGSKIELILTKQIRERMTPWGRVFQRIDVGRRTPAPTKPKTETKETPKKNEISSINPSVARLLITTAVMFVAFLIMGFWLFRQ